VLLQKTEMPECCNRCLGKKHSQNLLVPFGCRSHIIEGPKINLYNIAAYRLVSSLINQYNKIRRGESMMIA